MQTFETLKSRIHIIINKIRELQQKRTSVEKIKEAATKEIQKVLNKQLQMYSQYNTFVSDCYKYVITSEQMKFELNLQQRNFVIKKNESQDLRERCADAEQKFKTLESELTLLRTETRKLYEVALESTNNVNPQQKEFKPYNAAFAKLPFTINEIDIQLQTAQAKVYCLGKSNADGESILRNYEELQANVQKLKEDIESMKVHSTTMEQETEELRGLWLAPLKDLVNRINANFGAYFSLINCVGEVVLQQPANINDFDQYGLCIKVKFRNAEPLQELTRQRQSGGERAVTTAIFMIALQELSTVPFRCVDEINQGMDAVNERRVFELIVKITEKANGSQYFLLTPKLLSNLSYGENVTVHCIFNGPFMVPCTAFDTTSYCNKLTDGRRRQNSQEIL